MKISALLLPASLIANAALATIFFSAQSGISWKTPASSVPADPLRATPAASTPAGEAGAFGTTPVRLAASGGQSLWQQLHMDDPQALTDRLKVAGFPGATAHAVAMALHSEKYAAARLAILGGTQDVPYWRIKSQTHPTPEQVVRLNELSETQSGFFVSGYFDADVIAQQIATSSGFELHFGNLSTEKIQQLLRIDYDYDRMESNLRRTSPDLGSANEPSAEEIATLEKEKLADFRAVLTPEEFAEFECRSGPTASRLHQQTSFFRPTEGEYQALFAIHRSVDEQLGIFSYTLNPEIETARAEALKNSAARIEAALGPDRYADYVQATSPEDAMINHLLFRLELPLRTASKINAVRDDITQRAATIRKDSQLTPAQRDTQLAALASEAKTKLSGTLGTQRGVDAYIDIKGDWLRALQPKPAAP